MVEPQSQVRHVIGCMTGTSLDGLDAALTRITGRGLDMTAEFVGMVSAPLPDTLRTTLLSMANGEAHAPIEFMRAARHLGVAHAEACAELIAKHGQGLDIDFVVAHGQTIWHAPADRLSCQLFDPWPIVRTLKLPVCHDLRQADLVAGGEGAPITPIADWVMYRSTAKGRFIVNLGGIANYCQLLEAPIPTTVAADDLVGCNILLDGVVSRLWPGTRYDKDGLKAQSGTVVPALSKVIHQAILEPKIRAVKDFQAGENQKGSLGRENYGNEWFAEFLLQVGGTHRPEDVLASTVDTVASAIASLIDDYHLDEMILAGGGCRNKALVAAISHKVQNLNATVIVTDDLGIPAEAREAMGFAVLGALSADGVPITLPQVTGSETPGVAGLWAYPNGPAR